MLITSLACATKVGNQLGNGCKGMAGTIIASGGTCETVCDRGYTPSVVTRRSLVVDAVRTELLHKNLKDGGCISCIHFFSYHFVELVELVSVFREVHLLRRTCLLSIAEPRRSWHVSRARSNPTLTFVKRTNARQ